MPPTSNSKEPREYSGRTPYMPASCSSGSTHLDFVEYWAELLSRRLGLDNPSLYVDPRDPLLHWVLVAAMLLDVACRGVETSHPLGKDMLLGISFPSAPDTGTFHTCTAYGLLRHLCHNIASMPSVSAVSVASSVAAGALNTAVDFSRSRVRLAMGVRST